MGGEEEIQVETGISWLHDTLRNSAQERMDYLKEAIAEGVPEGEYRQMVGRYKEAKRQLTIVLPDIFRAFYQSEEAEDEELGDLSDG